MTLEEKIKAIRNLEQDYLQAIDELKKNYRTEVKKMMKATEEKKIEKVRAKLKSKKS